MLKAQLHSRFAKAEALQEIHRVLIPGGTLGMIWNIEDCQQDACAIGVPSA